MLSLFASVLFEASRLSSSVDLPGDAGRRPPDGSQGGANTARRRYGAGAMSRDRQTGGSAMPVTIYGIRNCDTMKKALAWLDGHGVDYTFHDYKKQGVGREALRRWCAAAGWETVLNRAGTTFRKLSDEDKAGLDEEKAIALMLSQPSMIKRPVLETGETVEIGFKPERYAAVFGA